MRATSLEQIRKEPAPYIVVNRDGVIFEINNQFTRAYGWSTEDICGQSLDVVLPEAFKMSHHLAFSSYSSEKTSAVVGPPLRLKTVCRDGSEITSEHYIITATMEAELSFAAQLVPLEENRD